MWTGPKEELISANGDKKTHDSRFEVLSESRQQYDLQVRKVKEEDGGVYVCKVMQGVKELTRHTFHLFVQSKAGG